MLSSSSFSTVCRAHEEIVSRFRTIVQFTIGFFFFTNWSHVKQWWALLGICSGLNKKKNPLPGVLLLFSESVRGHV